MKISPRTICASILISCVSCIPVTSYANPENVLTIINHFDQPIKFIVGKNPDVLPDFLATFTLESNNQIKSRVLDVQKQAYIRGEATNNNSVFFGVGIEGQQTAIHGYIGHGIAYSWKNSVVTFCTPEEYKKNKSC